MTQRRTTFRDEFAIIPELMIFAAVIAFACAMYLVLNVMPRHSPHPPIFPVRLLMAVAAGTGAAAYLLLVGYVNQDAKRRDMGQLLWTLLVIFIPNGIGFLAYFLLRKPLSENCPKCGARVEKGFHFCPKCGNSLLPTCIQCGQPVSAEYVCCPYCGKALGAQTT